MKHNSLGKFDVSAYISLFIRNFHKIMKFRNKLLRITEASILQEKAVLIYVLHDILWYVVEKCYVNMTEKPKQKELK